jgi:hypothetical protein
LKVLPSNISLGSLSLGKAGFSYKERFINKKFTSTDRFNEVEFDRIYNTSGSSTQQDEQFREARLNLIPFEELNINSLAGFLKRGDSFHSNSTITQSGYQTSMSIMLSTILIMSIPEIKTQKVFGGGMQRMVIIFSGI